VGADRFVFGTDAPSLTSLKREGVELIRQLNLPLVAGLSSLRLIALGRTEAIVAGRDEAADERAVRPPRPQEGANTSRLGCAGRDTSTHELRLCIERAGPIGNGHKSTWHKLNLLVL
jgi:hypothetical protein